MKLILAIAALVVCTFAVQNEGVISEEEKLVAIDKRLVELEAALNGIEKLKQFAKSVEEGSVTAS